MIFEQIYRQIYLVEGKEYDFQEEKPLDSGFSVGISFFELLSYC